MDVERVIANAEAEAAERATTLTSGHPTEAELWAYLHGDLESGRRRRIGAHLGSCPDCRAELASLREALGDLAALLPQHLEAPAFAQELPTARRRGGWLRRLERWLQPVFGPRQWAWHAAAFLVGSAALIGLNSYLHAAFMPAPSPFGSPPSPPWWAEWWTPYAVGAWAVLLGLHGLSVWRGRRREDARSTSSGSSSDESGE